jgi:hypothetical protein
MVVVSVQAVVPACPGMLLFSVENAGWCGAIPRASQYSYVE